MPSVNCGTSSLRAPALIIVLAILLALIGCSGNNSFTPQVPEIALFNTQLPLPLDVTGDGHLPAALHPTTVAGADAVSQSGNAQAEGSAMRLDAAAGNVEWAIYKVSTAGYQLASLSVNYAASGGNETWVGWADFGSNTWVFSAPYPAGMPPLAIGSGSYTYGGNFYFAVVAYNGTHSTISSAAVSVDVIPGTHTVSGTVLDDTSSPLAGAIVSLSPGLRSVITDSQGSYSFGGLEDGSYTLTPASSGFNFTPSNRQVALSGTDVSGVDFSGQPHVVAVSYTNDIRPILNNHCITCHSGSGAPRGIKLDSFADAKANAAAANAAVQSGLMPLVGSLTADEKALLQAWVDAQAPL
jgi:hypothetical protein